MSLRSLLLATLEVALFAISFHLLARAQAKPAAAAASLQVRHIHIRVNDVDRTKAFYRDKIGFKVTNETLGAVVEFEGLWFGKWRGEGTLVPQGITIGLAAASVEKTYQMVKQRGVDLPNAPAPARAEYSFTFKDPDGYEIEVEGPK